MSQVTITVTLNQAQAMALAQFVKRVGFQEMRANAVDDSEAYRMSYAICKVRDALVEVGYAPR